jgi:hypothetical protein
MQHSHSHSHLHHQPHHQPCHPALVRTESVHLRVERQGTSTPNSIPSESGSGTWTWSIPWSPTTSQRQQEQQQPVGIASQQLGTMLPEISRDDAAGPGLPVPPEGQRSLGSGGESGSSSHGPTRPAAPPGGILLSASPIVQADPQKSLMLPDSALGENLLPGPSHPPVTDPVMGATLPHLAQRIRPKLPSAFTGAAGLLVDEGDPQAGADSPGGMGLVGTPSSARGPATYRPSLLPTGMPMTPQQQQHLLQLMQQRAPHLRMGTLSSSLGAGSGSSGPHANLAQLSMQQKLYAQQQLLIRHQQQLLQQQQQQGIVGIRPMHSGPSLKPPVRPSPILAASSSGPSPSPRTKQTPPPPPPTPTRRLQTPHQQSQPSTSALPLPSTPTQRPQATPKSTGSRAPARKGAQRGSQPSPRNAPSPAFVPDPLLAAMKRESRLQQHAEQVQRR